MNVETYSYRTGGGWSANAFPKLDEVRGLVVAFGAPSFARESAPLAELMRAIPDCPLIGCSTSGEILGERLSDESLVVAAVEFDHTEVRQASAAVRTSADSFAAGAQLARELAAAPDLRGVFVLSDGLSVNGSELVQGVNSILPESAIVTGGLAGDGDRFQRTWVLDRKGAQSGVVTAIGLYGDRVQIGHGSKGGWDSFGPERVVTRSRDNVLFELDGRPALQLYETYLGERAAGLPATALLFPLALRATAEDSKVLVRTILAIDQAAQSLTFAGNIPEGSLVQLMRANFERLIEGASQAALHARRGRVGAPAASPTLSIAISCVGRRLILGQRAEEEIEAALDELPLGTRQVGFYSYGEISPYASGRCDLHNQTMTLTTFCED